ncbi:hypothetical protein FQN54_009724 [Arachnomyces sp. PD_36]|nr:hypothetical protein FQN54_009724 [Arachnomyces sp. PD_36]
MDVKSLPGFKVIPYSSTSSSPPSTIDEQPSDISVRISSSWTYCGPLLTLNPSSLPTSFHTWAEATLNGSILNPLFSFLAFAHEFLRTNNLSHYWLTIRASKGSHEFDLPRWHTDDLFYSQNHFNTTPSSAADLPPSERRLIPRRKKSKLKPGPHRTSSPKPDANGCISPAPWSPTASTDAPGDSSWTTDWKITTTLLGPGTLFISPKTSTSARTVQKAIKASVRAENKGHVCVSIKCVGCSMASEKVREQLAEALKSHDIVQANIGECTYFQTGDEEGAVHSEPESHGDRIFVNLVPGKEGELIGLTEKWGLEYPRAWCVGVPIMWDEECLRDVGKGNIIM